MKRILAILVSIFVIVAAAAVGGYYWLTSIYANEPIQFANEKIIEIPAGASGQQIATLLESNAVIRHGKAFRLLSVLEKQNMHFQAGEYLFGSGITPFGVMEKLVKGVVIRRKITIPEGKTSAEIVALLTADERLTGEIKTLPAEGSLLPETYDFTKGTERQEMVVRMQDAQQKVMSELWELRQLYLPFTTSQEAMTLASIIEKETGKPEERPRIAGVYVNRLRKGMLLQADPTVAYGVYGGQYADKALTLKDLKTDTPYNTYTRKGLPPTPICNVGKAAIAAALQPMVTDELYFVATGDGGHRFSKTLVNHNSAVADYRKRKKEIIDK